MASMLRNAYIHARKAKDCKNLSLTHDKSRFRAIFTTSTGNFQVLVFYKEMLQPVLSICTGSRNTRIISPVLVLIFSLSKLFISSGDYYFLSSLPKVET